MEMFSHPLNANVMIINGHNFEQFLINYSAMDLKRLELVGMRMRNLF